MIEPFLANLRNSRLLTAAQLVDVEREFGQAGAPAEPRDVAARFVERELLTRWQAKMLLAGQTAFFLGKYKLLTELGRGGMGAVYKAEQQPLGRIVAVKVMSRKLVHDQGAVARFHREIQAAAALNHPNVVAAFDADQFKKTHFLVMEFVESEGLDEILKREQRLPIATACDFVRQAALGLQHAFERGMAHRDIKPANLLLTHDAGGGPVIKILDMGLARFTSELREESELTATGQIMGTPDYIAPEQARDTKSADIRSDIYSLGCTLFRAIVGKVPFERGNVMEKLLARSLADAPRLCQVVPDAPRELEQILARMLARDPRERYQTPAEVAAALAPFASGAPLSAASPLKPIAAFAGDNTFSPRDNTLDPFPPAGTRSGDSDLDDFLQQLATEAAGTDDDQHDTSRIEHAPTQTPARVPHTPASPTPTARTLRAAVDRRRHQARRQVFLIGGGMAGLLLLAVATFLWNRAGITWLIVDLPEAERQAESIEIDGVKSPLPKTGVLKFSGTAGKRSVRITRPGFQPVSQDWNFARGQTQTFRPEWEPLVAATASKSLLTPLRERVNRLAASDPASAEVAQLREELLAIVRGRSGTAEALTAGQLVRRLPFPADALRRDAIPAEALLAAGEGSADGAPAEIVAILGDGALQHWGLVTGIAYASDGRLITSGTDEFIRVWDAATGRRRPALGGVVGTPALAADGSLAAGMSSQGSLTLWDLRSGAARHLALENTSAEVLSLAFSADAGRLAAGLADGEIVVWQIPDLTVASRFRTGAQPIRRLAFSPDGQTLAGFGDDKQVRVWSVRSGELRHTLATVGNALTEVAFHPMGKLLACGMWIPEDGYGKVQVWDSDTGRELKLLPKIGAIARIAFSPQGRYLIAGTENWDESGWVACWEVDGWRELWHTRTPFEITVRSLAFSPDDQTLAIGGQSGRISRCRVETGEFLTDLDHDHVSSVSSVAVSSDGSFIVSGSYDGSAIVWDVATQAIRHTLRGHDLEVYAVAISADGKTIATGSRDAAVVLWNADDGTERRRMPGHNYRVASLDFSPDGRWLVSGGMEGRVIVWDVAQGLEARRLPEELPVFGVAFGADNQTVAVGTGSAASTYLKVWNLANEKRPTSKAWKGFADAISSVDISPDGTKVLACGNPVKLIDLKRGSESTMNINRPTSLRYSPDGKTVAGYQGDHLQLWSANSFTEQQSIPLRFARDVAFTPDGRHIVTANANGTLYILRLEERDAKPAE